MNRIKKAWPEIRHRFRARTQSFRAELSIPPEKDLPGKVSAAATPDVQGRQSVLPKTPASYESRYQITVYWRLDLVFEVLTRTAPPQRTQSFNELRSLVFAIVLRIFCFPQHARQDILIRPGKKHFARQPRRRLRVENNHMPGKPVIPACP